MAAHDPTHSAAPNGGPATRTSSNPTPPGDPAVTDPVATTGGNEPGTFAGTPHSSAGRYDLGEEIARGGMGVVYRATDVAFGREVAVKVLQDRYTPTSGTARRFADEARITGQLQHPGIPPVHDLGVLPDGRPFLAMKLIKGQTLEELLTERPDPAHDRGRFVAAFEQVCQAVAYAHAHKVIHRDLKPANVMVGSFGEVQVMDWGLAKVLGNRLTGTEADPDETVAGTEIRSMRESDGSETQAGSVLGTPAFMSPEQALGAINKIDARSDVFGLGGVLAVILTGKPPFMAGSTETIRIQAAQGKVDECFTRLDACGADPGLIALAKRCLTPTPSQRPASAGEVARAVAELRAAADERARRAELDRVRAESEAREQRKRRRVQAVLGLTLVAAVALVGFGMWREEKRAVEQGQAKLEREREQADQEREQAERERAQAAALVRARMTARQRLETVLDRATTAYREDHLPEGDAALDRAVELLDPAQANEFQVRYEELRADRAILAELNRVWARANTLVDDRLPGGRRTGGFRFDYEAARTGYPAAFAARGLKVTAGNLDELAGRVARSVVRDRLVAALDDWLLVAAAADRSLLCDLLRRADPEPARNEIRKAIAEPSRLPDLFNNPPPDSALGVAARVASLPSVPLAKALPVLQAAAVRQPDDFRIQYAAGIRMMASDAVAAVGYFRAAVSLRKDSPAAVFALGLALRKPAEAAPLYLRAIELDPGFASAYINLADTFRLGADPASAIAFFERAIAGNSKQAMLHFGLGMALRERDPQRAAASFRTSIALDDTFAMAHNYLGYVTPGLDDRIKCFRRAIELDPSFAFAHYNLAGRLREKRDIDGALAEYNEALRLFPDHTFSHRDLATLLLNEKRDVKGAAVHFKRLIELNPAYEQFYPILGQCLMATNDLAGANELYRAWIKQFPASPMGYDGLVLVLGRQGAHTDAIRTYQDAMLRATPAWPESIRRQLRYNAACAAALAGTGSGPDPPPLADRPLFRRQALDWLRADLALCKKQAASSNAAERKRAADWLTTWQKDTDLSSVRPGLARPGMPSGERDEWDAFWADVRVTLADAKKPPPLPEVAPPPRLKG